MSFCLSLKNSTFCLYVLEFIGECHKNRGFCHEKWGCGWWNGEISLFLSYNKAVIVL